MLLGLLKIEGHSMLPFLKPGDVIVVSSVPYIFSKPKVYDVVIFKYDKKIIVKRIEKIIGEKYFLKGDNKTDSMDSRSFGPVSKKNIVGKVIFSFA